MYLGTSYRANTLKGYKMIKVVLCHGVQNDGTWVNTIEIRDGETIAIYDEKDKHLALEFYERELMNKVKIKVGKLAKELYSV